MSTDKTAGSSLAKYRGGPFLFRDRDGRTLFYDNGTTSFGYIVTDVAREHALQEAINRFRVFDSMFAFLMLIPTTRSLFALYSDRAFAELSLCIAIVVIGRHLARSWFFSELVVGLDRSEPFDANQRKKGNLFLLFGGFAYLSFVAWRILIALGVA
ncbi:hypothetical protein [Bradyrhizobium sp.]|uniref:hypothetical protein n=1 Tax=Bradyrhizobium sp. TaxID=376 RepID=UPI002608FABD|nr:hypothetical protein [Bradyrhizobium sp.]